MGINFLGLGRKAPTDGSTHASPYVRYEHHGRQVFVREDLKGKHRDHCLCFSCGKFTPDNRRTNCPIANALYSNCVQFGVVTPVYECPEFKVR